MADVFGCILVTGIQERHVRIRINRTEEEEEVLTNVNGMKVLIIVFLNVKVMTGVFFTTHVGMGMVDGLLIVGNWF